MRWRCSVWYCWSGVWYMLLFIICLAWFVMSRDGLRMLFVILSVWYSVILILCRCIIIWVVCWLIWDEFWRFECIWKWCCDLFLIMLRCIIILVICFYLKVVYEMWDVFMRRFFVWSWVMFWCMCIWVWCCRILENVCLLFFIIVRCCGCSWSLFLCEKIFGYLELIYDCGVMCRVCGSDCVLWLFGEMCDEIVVGG